MSSCCTPANNSANQVDQSADCCATLTTNGVHTSVVQMTNCPICGTKGKAVDTQTLKAMLAISLEALRPAEYRFCRSEDCPVVYFSTEGQQTFSEADLRELTWHNCGIVRTGTEMQSAIRRLDRLSMVPATSPSRAGYELRNLHTVAQIIARCALARQESRGGHYRSDFPQPKPEFQYHSSITKDNPNVSFR